MKKLLGYIIMLAILGGSAFYFFGNNTLVYSSIINNTESLLICYNNAVNDYADATSYELNSELSVVTDGVSKKTWAVYAKRLKTETNANFYVCATNYNEDGSVSGTSVFYYEGTDSQGILYSSIVTGSSDPVKECLALSTQSAVSNGYLELVANGGFISAIVASVFEDYSTSGLTLSNFADNDFGNWQGAKLAFDFSNLFFGSTLVWSEPDSLEVDETAFTELNVGIDVFGKLKLISYRDCEDNVNYSQVKYNIVKYNDSSIAVPTLTNEQKATY